MQLPFKTKQTRPLSLFNQGCCITDRELSDILALGDEDLKFHEFRSLFHIARCVGTYDELVYFLPHALEYIKQNPDDGFECMSHIVHFVSGEVESLGGDGLIEPCRNAIWGWFKQWTTSFSVQHYDEQACKQKGWIIKYDDIVANSQLVCELVDYLLWQRTHADLAKKMIRSLAQQDQDQTQSAWFLEYAHEVRAGYIVSQACGDSEIQRLVTDEQLLQSHYDRIASTVVAREKSPTYWPDVCKALSLNSATRS